MDCMAIRNAAHISFSPLTSVNSNLVYLCYFAIKCGIFLICKVCLCTLLSTGNFTNSASLCLIYLEDQILLLYLT